MSLWGLLLLHLVATTGLRWEPQRRLLPGVAGVASAAFRGIAVVRAGLASAAFRGIAAARAGVVSAAIRGTAAARALLDTL